MSGSARPTTQGNEADDKVVPSCPVASIGPWCRLQSAVNARLPSPWIFKPVTRKSTGGTSSYVIRITGFEPWCAIANLWRHFFTVLVAGPLATGSFGGGAFLA